MMHRFFKYQGAGNDFVIFDNREGKIDRNNTKLFSSLCDRKFGIGADGLMLLQEHEGYDFEMIYFNADGSESSMCGNGGRCLAAFAASLGLTGSDTKFLAVDGPHYAKISGNTVDLQMIDIDLKDIQKQEDHFVLNTGSPHFVTFVKQLSVVDVFHEGRRIRNAEAYRKEGINVNFVEELPEGLYVRTYERGVEDETLSCGTGVTAAAMALAVRNELYGNHAIHIVTLGGKLTVSFNRSPHSFGQVFLSGPADFVFQGEISF